MDKPLIAIDVGGGTQDILLYDPIQPLENCVQLVLPSQTVVVGRKITRASRAGRSVFLHGTVMGGGASTRAIRQAVSSGTQVFAAPDAAKTVHDNLERVRELGVVICDQGPPDAVNIQMGDINRQGLEKALEAFEVVLPECWAVAVQDHGESPKQSNREFRFRHWRRLVEEGGDLKRLVYREPPAYFTRMHAVKKQLPGAMVMDTGSAAIWGALCDSVVKEVCQQGVIILNIGNQHTVAVLVKGEKILGLFEHHTGLMNRKKLADYIERLRTNQLTHKEVYADGGHGCYVREDFHPQSGFQMVAVTGPQRHMATGLGYYYANPYGDMMLTGCFGLVEAFKRTAGENAPLTRMEE